MDSPLNLSDLDGSDRGFGLARDRNGGTGQPVGEELLGVVLADSWGSVKQAGERTQCQHAVFFLFLGETRENRARFRAEDR